MHTVISNKYRQNPHRNFAELPGSDVAEPYYDSRPFKDKLKKFYNWQESAWNSIWDNKHLNSNERETLIQKLRKMSSEAKSRMIQASRHPVRGAYQP